MIRGQTRVRGSAECRVRVLRITLHGLLRQASLGSWGGGQPIEIGRVKLL
jgi:hypothetical protein